jgi:hypothetical protein
LAFVGGTGNTGIFIDDVTTPLTYTPSGGAIGAKKITLTTSANVITVDSATPNFTITDGIDVVDYGIVGIAANNATPFEISNPTGLTLNATTSRIQFLTGTGSYVFPTTNGSNGQVLTTNGAGTLSWTTASGGASSVTSVNGLTGAVKIGRSISVYAPTTTDNITMFYTANSLTLSNIESVIRGSGTGVTFSVKYGTDRSTSGTEVVTNGINCTNTTTGLSTTSFNNGTISASSFVWLTVSGVSGNPNELSVTLEF